MKLKIKSLITRVSVYTIFLFVFFGNFAHASPRTKNDFFVCLNTNTDGEENNNELDFIKSNEGVINFLGDGWILLYGGISLVAVSVAGIVFVLIPKKGKNGASKKKVSRQSNHNSEE